MVVEATEMENSPLVNAGAWKLAAAADFRRQASTAGEKIAQESYMVTSKSQRRMGMRATA